MQVNLAMCLVKMAAWEEAITACGAALKLEPSSAKAHLFRARALAASPHRADGLKRAREDLLAAQASQPSDRTIAADIDLFETKDVTNCITR